MWPPDCGGHSSRGSETALAVSRPSRENWAATWRTNAEGGLSAKSGGHGPSSLATNCGGKAATMRGERTVCGGGDDNTQCCHLMPPHTRARADKPAADN